MSLVKYMKPKIANKSTILEEFCTEFPELDSILRFIFDLPWHKWFPSHKKDEFDLPGQKRRKSMHEELLDESFKQKILRLVELCEIDKQSRLEIKKLLVDKAK
jgi:hypothetical protein